jgi:hypothetical protein
MNEHLFVPRYLLERYGVMVSFPPNQVPLTRSILAKLWQQVSPDCFTWSVVLTWRTGTLQDLFSIYPKAASMFRSFTRAANLDKGIRSIEFQTQKDRMHILHFLLDKLQGSGHGVRFSSLEMLSFSLG